MSNLFNADEVLKMAEQIERRGVEFYKEAADAIDDEKSKAFLLGLAEMEKDHIAYFANMRSELKDQDKTAFTFDPNNEMEMYIQALADTEVFNRKEIDLSSLKSIYKAAIKAEKDSIAFYLGIKNSVPEKAGQDKIDKIIKEEMNHITILSKKLAEATS